MPAPEIVLRFPSSDKVSVSYNGDDSGLLSFASPVTDKDRQDIRWYVEIYGAHSLSDGDDKDAQRIEARLTAIGKALFEAVFGGANRAAERVFNRFQDADAEHRVLTIDSQSAAILSLPWELLHDPTGVFLFRENPHISVRRRISGATGGRSPFQVQPKDALHLLFVVSRPDDAGFLDPRADPAAVLDALEEHAPGRFTWEVLRPPTLDALAERLRDRTRTPVDILHFDGHGVFEKVSEQEAERDPHRFGRSIRSEIQRERQARDAPESNAPVGIGFLLFEQADGSSHLISAQDLAENLFRSRVGLVVLSACQTATLDAEGDPMASVAGRLASTGIPAILAMTHAVLAVTTRHLFGQFYRSLARGNGIAGALDDARAWLANHPEKFEVWRSRERSMLRLDDWFLPALFHAGADTPLLTDSPQPEKQSDASNAGWAQGQVGGSGGNRFGSLRERHEAGFFGRRRELWQIERWLAADTRRLSIVGFGGQGKTELALEAARWLLRTGMFRRAVFVDYAQVQSDDALSVAVSTISTAISESLPDAEAAGRALSAVPTLVILDNLESLAAVPLAKLLKAAAAWTERGTTRVLLTSRRADFEHVDYHIEGTRKHRRIMLDGLGSVSNPHDALDWYAVLASLPGADDDPPFAPPSREALISLFDQVAFHPLSIAVLAQQLRTRSAAQLGERLSALLDDEAVSAIAEEGTPHSLIASLRLSLDRLTPEQREAVRRLGVFRGGAFEDDLLAITGLGVWERVDGEREHLSAFIAAIDRNEPRAVAVLMQGSPSDGSELLSTLPISSILDNPEIAAELQRLRLRLAALSSADSVPQSSPWRALRQQLESAALIEAERVASVGPPFLRFHPTLAPVLWAWLTADEQAALTLTHRKRYYELAGYLYQSDSQTPDHARAIARRELPNLLHAVDQTLASNDEAASDFVDSVTLFLRSFGFTREAEVLTLRTEQVSSVVGSTPWYLAQSNRGEQLLVAGQVVEARARFQSILQVLGESSSPRLAATLGRLARCHATGGHSGLAEAHYRRAIDVTSDLEQDDYVKRLSSTLHTGLGDVLRQQGRYVEARATYEKSLELKRDTEGDPRGEGVVLAALGTLALEQDLLGEAVQRYQEAVVLFQRLGEPAVEAVAHHQLGIAFRRAGQLEPAERHCRESARLCELCGDLAGAARSWGNLAIISEMAGRSEAAEIWYRKAIEAKRDNPHEQALTLSNFADLLQSLPGRLAEARQIGEEALAIKKTLDPNAAQIWKIYSILAEIADRQARPDEAVGYRRQARDAKRDFAGTAHELKPFLPLIVGAVHAVSAADPMLFLQALSELEQGERTNLVGSIRKLLAGQRDVDTLCALLTLEESMIIDTILQILANPGMLETLLAQEKNTQ